MARFTSKPYYYGGDADGNRGIWLTDTEFTSDISGETLDSDDMYYLEDEQILLSRNELNEKFFEDLIYEQSKETFPDWDPTPGSHKDYKMEDFKEAIKRRLSPREFFDKFIHCSEFSKIEPDKEEVVYVPLIDQFILESELEECFDDFADSVSITEEKLNDIDYR